MISKELFIKMIKTAERFEEEVDRWSDFGIDVFELPIGEIPWEMFNCWIDSHFNSEGQDWIHWYLWERKSLATGDILPCYDENGVEFYVHTPTELWNIVQEYRLKDCKDFECPLKSKQCTN